MELVVDTVELVVDAVEDVELWVVLVVELDVVVEDVVVVSSVYSPSVQTS